MERDAHIFMRDLVAECWNYEKKASRGQLLRVGLPDGPQVISVLPRIGKALKISQRVL